jgi:predicted phosphodiesterase
MRLAVLSDIHGNLPALEAVLKDLRSRGADAVVNLGDSLSGPLLPLETAAFLMAQDWPTLAGNHERQVLDDPDPGPSDAYARACLTPRELDWMAALPATAWFGEEVFLCHGTPGSDLDSLLETLEPHGIRPATAAEVTARLGACRAPVVLCGHTHVPRSVRSRAGQLVVNPGSVGLPAIETTRPFKVIVETGSPDARYALLDRHPGGWTASLVTVPYDHHAMAALAGARRRPDWEVALRSGTMAG